MGSLVMVQTDLTTISSKPYLLLGLLFFRFVIQASHKKISSRIYFRLRIWFSMIIYVKRCWPLSLWCDDWKCFEMVRGFHDFYCLKWKGFWPYLWLSIMRSADSRFRVQERLHSLIRHNVYVSVCYVYLC